MRLLFFILCFLSLQSSYSQKDSINFRTGNFYVLKGTDTCFVTRTETRQKEKCGNDDKEYQFIVIWLRKKKYILRDIYYNPSTAERVMRKDAIMTILEVHEDHYLVHGKIKGQGKYIFKVYYLDE